MREGMESQVGGGDGEGRGHDGNSRGRLCRACFTAPRFTKDTDTQVSVRGERAGQAAGAWDLAWLRRQARGHDHRVLTLA